MGDAVPLQPADLGVEVDSESSTGDSALGSDIDTLGSASVSSSIYGYKYENGRRYHAYREGAYLLPNDADEQDRLDLHHHVYRLQIGGSLFRAPLGGNIGRVLDIGTGTGIWAIDFADEHPDSMVIGTDLSPIQPDWLPPNCKFYVDDIDSEWTWNLDEAFDYIHGRSMDGCTTDWLQLMTRALEHLKPGGWFELQEYEAAFFSDDDPDLLRAPYIKQWLECILEAASKFGKPMNQAATHGKTLQEAGYVDVTDDVIKVPVGTWARDPKLKEVGRYQREHMIACIAPFTLAPFLRVLGWQLPEVEVLMAGIRSEFRNPKLHLYARFHFVYGRKPTSLH